MRNRVEARRAAAVMDVALHLSGTMTTWHYGTGTKRINLTNVPCAKQKGQYPEESAERKMGIPRCRLD